MLSKFAVRRLAAGGDHAAFPTGWAFGVEAWQRSDRQPLPGLRCSSQRWGVTKPYSVADRGAVTEVLGLRLQALSRQVF